MERRYGSEPRFVVISTGRAGSGFVAALLTACGVPCGHEAFFTPSGLQPRFRWHLRGDSSWLAVPALEEWNGAKPLVVHQVRDPREVVKSLVGIGLFRRDNDNPFAQFARRHFSVSGDEVRDAMRWWVAWNRRCAALAHFSYRLEEIGAQSDAFFEAIDETPTREPRTVIAALRDRNINTRKSTRIAYPDMPDGPEKDELRSEAARFGYDLAP
jgi:hypothetical protein